jgi:hypothetical protein
VLFREAVCQERIANGAWKWNVNCPADMHVSEFGVSDAELPPAEAMWMNRYMRPSAYLLRASSFVSLSIKLLAS